MTNVEAALKEKVLKTISRYRMLQAGERVLVAVSGGPDSVALLHLLVALSSELALKLHVFHLNHQMRGAEAEKDARFVKKMAKDLGIPATFRSFDVPSFLKKSRFSPQEGARQIRFKLLEEEADKIEADKIALGHQADDQMETFLIRLIKGTGTDGLRGIPPVRDRFIRPLIEISRDEIEAYLKEKKIDYRLDATNLETRYLRNKVRRELVPVLKKYNPCFLENLLKLTTIIRDEQAFLEEELGYWFPGKREKKEKGVLPLVSFIGVPIALIRLFLRQQIAFVKGDLKDVEFKHIEPIVSFLEGKTPSIELDLPGDTLVFNEYENLIITKKALLRTLPVTRVWLNVPGETEVPELKMKVIATFQDEIGETKRGSNAAMFDADVFEQPLSVRTRLPGDRFQPLGLRGTKKLQNFFVDEKVPEKERDRVPLIESGGKIVWVVGHRIDDAFKLSDKTRKILLLECVALDETKE